MLLDGKDQARAEAARPQRSPCALGRTRSGGIAHPIAWRLHTWMNVGVCCAAAERSEERATRPKLHVMGVYRDGVKGSPNMANASLTPCIPYNEGKGARPRVGLTIALISSSQILAILYDGGKAAQEEPRLLGTVENQLGIREYLESHGHEFIVSSSKEGPESHFQQHLKDAEVLITTPFHPGYLTRDLIQKAPHLKLCITAGVGSDHIDLNAAVDHKIQVLEVSGSNVVSVAEHVVMSILLLVRNFVPAHEMIERGDWQVSQIARHAFDLENKVVGTIGAGRIGYRVLQRLVPFDCKELLYYDYAPLPAAAAKAINVRRVEDLKEFVSQCDVVTVNCPLHEGTRGLVNAELLQHFKKGAWLVNTARGAICDKDAVAAALTSGQLSGYAGDVWNVQPAPRDHVWRTMKNPLGGGNGMVPHYSGTTLDAQARYANGVRSILKNYFEGTPQDPVNVIVGESGYATKALTLVKDKLRGWPGRAHLDMIRVTLTRPFVTVSFIISLTQPSPSNA
ncbi:hypothetical protein BV25DRAFT_1841255 [Artomyces pyxidatus]|uniref:Uncharacterized protein n=1 Tax=Artomyces pyxidatus TaxID=48021 RepID=A0ACB8SPS3_9AGAM|nr:hypothetical protein BV25DRAFT_1841255 [Artomyces pyxidatus]